MWRWSDYRMQAGKLRRCWERLFPVHNVTVNKFSTWSRYQCESTSASRPYQILDLVHVFVIFVLRDLVTSAAAFRASDAHGKSRRCVVEVCENSVWKVTFNRSTLDYFLYMRSIIRITPRCLRHHFASIFIPSNNITLESQFHTYVGTVVLGYSGEMK